MNLYEVLRERGYKQIDTAPYDSIRVWQSWYEGDVKKFHTYRVFNGSKHVQVRRYTMGMAKKVAEDWASLLMNEKVVITLEGEKEQEFIDKVFEDNNFRVKASELQEHKAATGTTAFVPRVTGASADEEGNVNGGDIKLDYVTAANIVPLTWENGVVSECAFATSRTAGKEKYLYVQIHKLNEQGLYDIENVVYKDQNGNLAEQTDTSTIPGFENMVPVVHTGSDKPLFVIDRMNIANNTDITSPMGVSVYANAIDQLKGVDIAYDSYVNEFILGKKRIFVLPEFTKNLDGEPVFDPNDTVYYVLQSDEGNSIQPIDMALRTAEHNAGIQDMLNALSSKVGFGNMRYQFDRGSVTTATQIISENSDMFRNIKKHEIILESVLIQLCRTLLRLGNQYQNAGLDEDVEISIDFDDSIIEDKTAERANDRMDMQMGILNPYEYRMKWYNEDEETAKSALPMMESLVSGAEVE